MDRLYCIFSGISASCHHDCVWSSPHWYCFVIGFFTKSLHVSVDTSGLPFWRYILFWGQSRKFVFSVLRESIRNLHVITPHSCLFLITANWFENRLIDWIMCQLNCFYWQCIYNDALSSLFMHACMVALFRLRIIPTSGNNNLQLQLSLLIYLCIIRIIIIPDVTRCTKQNTCKHKIT